MNPHKEYKDDPDSDVNVPKTIKKTALNWLVTGLLAVLCLGVLALGRAQVSEMLVNYETKAQAEQRIMELNAKIDTYAKQVQDMRETLYLMDKKLDHLQFILDYNQEHGKPLLTPKQNDL